MPKTPLSLDERLTKFKITQERYLRESQLLRQAGFDEQQIERLILKKQSFLCVQKVLSAYQTLLEPPYCFTREQIVKIASHYGGSKNLEAVQEAFKAIRDLGFNTEQVVKMVSHDGGSKNLQAVQEAYQVLLGLNFSAEQVVRMVSHDGGSKNLQAVQETYLAFQRQGYSSQEIYQVSCHSSGSMNIRYLLLCSQRLDLIQSFHLTKDDLINILGRPCGHLLFKRACLYYEKLSSYGFSFKNIVSIVKSSKINAELLNRFIEKIHQEMNLDVLIHCATKKEFKTWLYEKLSLWTDEEYSYLKEIFSLEDDSSNLHEESEEFRALLAVLQELNDDEDTKNSDLGFLDGMIVQLETLIAPTNNFKDRRSLFSNKRSRDDGVTFESNKRLDQSVDCNPQGYVFDI